MHGSTTKNIKQEHPDGRRKIYCSIIRTLASTPYPEIQCWLGAHVERSKQVLFLQARRMATHPVNVELWGRGVSSTHHESGAIFIPPTVPCCVLSLDLIQDALGWLT